MTGQLIDGRSVSLTVTEKLHPLVLPAASVTPQATAVTPTKKLEPLDCIKTLRNAGYTLAVGKSAP